MLVDDDYKSNDFMFVVMKEEDDHWCVVYFDFISFFFPFYDND